MKPHNLLPYKFGDATALQFSKEGYGRSVNKMARDGIYQYMGYELGSSDQFEPSRVYNVLRRPETVGEAESLASFAGKPMTVDHPFEDVDLRNHKDYAVGHIGDDARIVVEDGVSFVEATNYITDANAIATILSGDQEISMGYEARMDFTGGDYELPNGETVRYDAEQLDIRINHGAIVPRGRAGSLVRVITDEAGKNPRYLFMAIDEEKRKLLTKPKKRGKGETDEDESPSNNEPISDKENPMPDNLKSFAFGDKAFNLDASDGAEIKALFDGQKDAHAAALTAKDEAHASELADVKGELATANDTIKDLESKVLDSDALDARIAKRADLLTVAKTLVEDIDTKGKSDRDVMVAVLKAKLPNKDFAEATDEAVATAFDTVCDLEADKADTEPTPKPKSALKGKTLGDGGEMSGAQRLLQRTMDASKPKGAE